MKPSKTDFKALGVDADKVAPTHDAISAWLLRAVRERDFGPYLLTLVPRPQCRLRSYEGIELEVPVVRGETVVGFADARLDFSGGVKLWIEIKTEDTAIGALVRQIKSYRLAGAAGEWIAILPEASIGAREILAHANVGCYLVPPVPASLVSASVRRRADDERGGFAAIPEAAPQ